MIATATTAYDDGQYAPARALYRLAAALPQGGHQERIYNGLYLTNRKLGDQDQAAEAFARLVAYGLEHNHLAVKFLFSSASTAFRPDLAISVPYPMWLRAIADQTAEAGAYLQLTGHASPSGSAELNDRLSLARAQRIARDLVRLDPELRGHLETRGAGIPRRPHDIRARESRHCMHACLTPDSHAATRWRDGNVPDSVLANHSPQDERAMQIRIAAALATIALLAACSNTPQTATTGAANGAGGVGGAGGVVPGSQQDLASNVGDRVYFAFDSSKLDPDNQTTLDRQAQWLQKYQQVPVQVAGNCDDRGTEEYNLALGQRRANAARDYLAARGVNPSRVETISFGKDRPIALGDNEEAWAKNRNATTSVR